MGGGAASTNIRHIFLFFLNLNVDQSWCFSKLAVDCRQLFKGLGLVLKTFSESDPGQDGNF